MMDNYYYIHLKYVYYSLFLFSSEILLHQRRIIYIGVSRNRLGIHIEFTVTRDSGQCGSRFSSKQITVFSPLVARQEHVPPIRGPYYLYRGGARLWGGDDQVRALAYQWERGWTYASSRSVAVQ